MSVTQCNIAVRLRGTPNSRSPNKVETMKFSFYNSSSTVLRGEVDYVLFQKDRGTAAHDTPRAS